MYREILSLIIFILLFIYIFLLKLKEQYNNVNSNLPVYVSLTSIFKNQNELVLTLESILKQTVTPDKIYLYLSTDAFILDDGFKNKNITNKKLRELLNKNKDKIEIKWVKNTGPFRKLLPIVKEKWNEDCIIIVFDDDIIYNENIIHSLVNDYKRENCVINYRGFTPKMNSITDFDYSNREKLKKEKHIYNFSTNGAGTLFKPNFFHKTNDLFFDEEIYLNYCSKQDDLWYYINRIINDVDCYIDNNKNKIVFQGTEGLWVNFNKIQNNNTVVFHKTLKKIKDKYPEYYLKLFTNK